MQRRLQRVKQRIKVLLSSVLRTHANKSHCIAFLEPCN